MKALVGKIRMLGKKKVNGDSHFLAVGVSMITVCVIGYLFQSQLTAIFLDLFSELEVAIYRLF